MSADYLAQAREASRRWRDGQGLPPRTEDDLLAFRSFRSSLPISEQEERKCQQSDTLSHGNNTTETTETTKEREERVETPTSYDKNDRNDRRVEAPAHYLRLVVRRWFTLAVAEVDGQRPAPAELAALHQEIVRLYDETGPAFADALIREEHRRFRWETARCGWCGRLGHDTECR